MKKNYRFCKSIISIESEFFPGDNPQWQQFETQDEKADILVKCIVCDTLPQHLSEVKSVLSDTTVSENENFVCRNVSMGTVPGVATIYGKNNPSYSESYFTKNSFNVMMDSRYMWNSIALPQLLLELNAFFLHASYIEHKGKAIVFSAPCGVGKSTQAALWERHRGAEIINGDKTGIAYRDGSFYACGLPVCGTSGICKNRTLPLGAIVLLGQSAQNRAEKLSGVDVLSRVVPNIYLDMLAENEQSKCFGLVIKLAQGVPVYRFDCTPDEQSVKTLEKVLEAEGVF